MLVVLVAFAAGGAYYYIQNVAPYETTDDAFLEAHVIPVAPQVPGRVERLFVSDNQEIHQGDPLLQIDPRDYQTRLDQASARLLAAKSQLDQARAQLKVDEARVREAAAGLAAEEAEASHAEADFKRYDAVGNLGVSKSQLDQAATKASTSTAGVEAARNKKLAAEALAGLDQATIEAAAAEVRRNEAAMEQARLDLSYTRLLATEGGLVTHRTVEAGAFVQPGQALLAIVPRAVYVVANFKETQLAHMRPGQAVEVKVDAYPQISFKAHVDSIQAGAGAHFSLLPPENASGNFVKVVQRVPVKIVLDDPAPAGVVLGPGMSVEPTVKVR